MIKPEIVEGALVVIDTEQIDQDSIAPAKGYDVAYCHLYPFRVRVRQRSHVILEGHDGKILHFGSNANPLFHVLWLKLSSFS